MAVAAVLVLARPGALLPLAGLFLAQVWALALDLPETSNHLLLAGLVSGLGLLALAGAAARAGGRPDPASVHRAFAPPARVVLLLLLLFAGVAKLNADWFRPEVSCGALLQRATTARWPFLPATAAGDWAAILGTVAVELAAPFLLLSRRLRPAGLLSCTAFLIGIGIAGFFQFSAITMALLFLFVRDDAAALVRRGMPGWRKAVGVARSAAGRRLVRMGTAVVAVTAIVIALAAPWAGSVQEPILIREIGTGTRPASSFAFEVSWWLLASTLLVALVAALRAGTSPWPSARALLAHPHPELAVVPLVVLLNGVAPYVGWKTEATFTMFSNLRTETAPNHWLVRGSLSRLGLRDDLATIESSTDPQLRALADEGAVLPLPALGSYVRQRSRADGPDFALTYVVEGRRREVERAGEDAALVAAPPVPGRWLAAFRPVSPVGPNRCRH